MTALQKIIAEAKKIRKKYPKKEWKDCVAQASAIYAKKHKGKSPVGKKSKKVGAVKKKAAKKKSATSYHKDTASHNVKIKVISGIGSIGKEKMLKNWQEIYGKLAAKYITANIKDRKAISKEMKITKQIISNLKKIK